MISAMVDCTYGSGSIALPAAANVIWQATTSAAKPISFNRIDLETNQLGNTQTILPLQLVTYVTKTSTNGHALTPLPTSHGLTATLTTSWYGNTITLGTTPTIIWAKNWNGVNPLDLVQAVPQLQDEFPVSTTIALILASTAGAGIFYTATVYYNEYG